MKFDAEPHFYGVGAKKEKTMHSAGNQPMRNKGFICCARVFTLFFVLFLGAASKNAFAFDLALIEPAKLAQSSGQWAVLDARPKSDWLAGHIPGSLSFSWKDYTYTDKMGRAYRLLPAGQLAASLGRMGINENTPVVVYGDAVRSMGGEGWITWVLLWLGHKGPIRVLDGGIQAWKDHGYPVEAGPGCSTRPVTVYKVRPRPGIDVKTRKLESKNRRFVLIDTRSELEWIMGRIPGAVHIPWTEFRTGRENRPLDRAGLEKLLESHGINPGESVVFYCSGGIRSGYAWTVYELDGFPRARNYLGGWESWRLRGR